MSNNWLKIARHLRLRKPYGYTGEWYGGYTHLLHLRARWYAPESGTFLSVDPVESEPPYQYVAGDPINATDPTGRCAQFGDDACWGVYEQIIKLCPECAHMSRPTIRGDRLLYEENIYHLQSVLERLRSPSLPQSEKPALIISILEDCDGTISINVGVSFSFVYEFGGDMGVFNADEHGNIAIGTFSISPVGGTTSVGFALNGGVLATNAANLGELQGWVVNLGGGGTAGVTGGGLDAIIGPEGTNGRILGINLFGFAGPKVGLPLPPAFIHGNANNTFDFALLTYDSKQKSLCAFNECSLSSFNVQKPTKTPVSYPK